jgi:UDP-N-acetylmuramate dehydrogenase
MNINNLAIRRNVSLKPYNSFRTQATADFFCRPKTNEELITVLNEFSNEKMLVIGAGCNLFFTKNFEGLIIKPDMIGIKLLNETSEFVELEVGAGEDWDRFVEFCVEKGYSGIENLSLIPGKVGAAPVQNIGAYGTEAKDAIVKVNAIDFNTSNFISFSNEECAFGYRDSIFKRNRQYIITSVVFRLNKNFRYTEKYADLNHEMKNVRQPSLQQVREAIIRIRSQKLPDINVLPNAGSFFKNPILTKQKKDDLLGKLPDAPFYPAGDESFKTSAAFLIEKAGYKGRRSGEVGIYEHHALIIVNYGTENGCDIVNFMHEVQQAVEEKFAIQLLPEVQIY